jgi:serine/threonine protein kinase
VKLLDFGLSKVWGPSDDQTRPAMTIGNGVVGTVAYMAPERLLSMPYDGRSDVYSLGVILYRMLCGSVPFEGDGSDHFAVAMRQLTAEPPSLSDCNPAIPRELAGLAGRMLSRSPQDRPSASELASILKRRCQGGDSALRWLGERPPAP